ncbi:MAG TPA: polysaccharide deacetylase family protein [Anaerolineales bacterium]|nr:polysaccharide deacetylase family protein [Anaerolineales bacterium]
MSSQADNKINRRDFLKISGLGLASLAIGHKLPREIERERLIQKYGPAASIPAFEFHGDNYYFFGGAYCMNPDTFKTLMSWFKENEVWPLTSDEVVAYLQGTIDLPSRSVILTTDSGNTSKTSLVRMIPVLQETGMHFISMIWTRFMIASESSVCLDDTCWNVFREARDSGVYSFGSHTESHSDFALFTQDEGLADILQSKQEIEDNLGFSPQLISWPFESVPSWAPVLSDYGFFGAFAGVNHRPTIKDCSILPSDPSPWDLPRILPPNIGTLTSGRPDGKTILEIMEMFTNGFGDQSRIFQNLYEYSNRRGINSRRLFFPK